MVILFALWSVAGAEERQAPKTTPPRRSVKPVPKPSPTSTPIVVGKNLVKNGDFEKKRSDHSSPENWDLCCGLTTFHEKYRKRGYVIRIDTTVPKEQARARWLVMKKLGVKAPPAPKKEKYTNRYATIGGVDGVHYYSDYIPVKKGARYKLRIDHKGKNNDMFFTKIFVKGYGKFVKKRNIRQPDGSIKEETVTEHRQLFKWYLACRNFTDGWLTAEDWIPCKMPQSIAEVRICIYAYWPIQDYFFDNVEFYEGKEPPEEEK